MYKQVLDPVGDSLFLSTLFAALPLVTLFVLLGGLKLKAHVAALWSLLVAILVAIIVYSMPVGQTLDAGAEGAAFGLFPIMWIVVNAIWIYTMLERSGYFAVIKRSFGRLSDDQRVQAVLIAFCFGALLEALAGFGTPGRDLLGHAHRPGLPARQGRRGRARRQHGARRLRRHRGADHDAGTAGQPPQGRPRRHGRPPDALPRPHRPAHPRRAWSTGAAASRPPGPPRWWAASPSPSASSRARTTSRSSWPTSSPRWPAPGRSSRCCSSGSPASVVGVPAGPRPAMAGGESGVDQQRFEKEARLRADAGPNGDAQARHPGRDHHRLLPLPDPDRRLRPGPDPLAAVLRLARRADQGVRLARAGHPQRQGQGSPPRSSSSSTGPTPRARCC